MENEEKRELSAVPETAAPAVEVNDVQTSAPAVEEIKEECHCCCEEKEETSCCAEEECHCCCEEKEETSCCAEEEAAPCCCAEEPARERKPRPQVEVTQEMIDRAVKALTTMLDFLALDGTVKAEKKPSKINLLVASEDAGRIIGRKGQSLESLQLLLNRMMQNTDEDFPKVYIDIDGYSSKNPTSPEGRSRRDREDRPRRDGRRSFDRSERRPRRSDREDDGFGGREEILRQQALDAAKEVRRWGEAKELPPMNSHDRRIIHITLENEPDLTTESKGDGAIKSVVISLKK